MADIITILKTVISEHVLNTLSAKGEELLCRCGEPWSEHHPFETAAQALTQVRDDWRRRWVNDQ